MGAGRGGARVQRTCLGHSVVSGDQGSSWGRRSSPPGGPQHGPRPCPPRPTLQASTPPPVPPLVPARCPCGAGRARSACVGLRRRMRAACGGRACALAAWRH